MKKKINYNLIEGIFSPTQAQKILLDLINAKISYHKLEDFSNHIRFNIELSNSEKRIEQLSETSNSIKDLIELAKNNNMELKINSNISIELIQNVQ
ncbi:MAG: hypothetical protein H7239_14335 [Flavobacterium sp.]|nr:hypothetical protein [Flavobacterium sp.]